MIKQGDLRIKNWVHATRPGEPDAELLMYQISSGKDIDNAHWYYPIPLTTEILTEWCGFRCEAFESLYRKGDALINLSEPFYCWWGEESSLIEEIKTLSDLQNWYYWNSGKKELEVKVPNK